MRNLYLSLAAAAAIAFTASDASAQYGGTGKYNTGYSTPGFTGRYNTPYSMYSTGRYTSWYGVPGYYTGTYNTWYGLPGYVPQYNNGPSPYVRPIPVAPTPGYWYSTYPSYGSYGSYSGGYAPFW